MHFVEWREVRRDSTADALDGISMQSKVDPGIPVSSGGKHPPSDHGGPETADTGRCSSMGNLARNSCAAGLMFQDCASSPISVSKRTSDSD
jgi:hypothetical protein